MTTILKYDKFFAYSDSEGKSFFTTFGPGVNIIHGCNTSGKSTLFLSLLYTFGINDGNQYLKEILNTKPIFRLDCVLHKDGFEQPLLFIRDEDTLFVKHGSKPVQRFNGISSNNAFEHVKLKDFFAQIFGFSLVLESKGELKVAPMETIFLPYYISQSVGWVYLRKSFSGLDFYRNFKEDYIDYYLGLSPSEDRVKVHALQAKLKEKQSEISLISRYESKNEDIQLTKLTDENFVHLSKEYVEKYTKAQSSLIDKENEYVMRCNELRFLEERKSVILKVSKGHKEQNPENGNCPACAQSLPIGISETYKFLQEENDSKNEVLKIKAKIIDTQARINSLQKSVAEERINIETEFIILNKYKDTDINYDSWLKNKANKLLIENIEKRLGALTIEKTSLEKELKGFKTDEEIEKIRRTESNRFTTAFLIYLAEMGVKKLEEDRYIKLYDISSFPYQGVELLKTIMAYHFAFNLVISETNNIHRLPFMLDAVFKEDIEKNNKDVILKFIAKNKPTDTQIIFSTAQTKEQLGNAEIYNRDFFKNEAKLIQIGNGETERSFLMTHNQEHSSYLDETLELINGV